MEWRTHGERELYGSDWVRLSLVDVEVPGISRYEHHVVSAADAAGTVLTDDDGAVLLLWRHRFLSGRWGWELPAGLVDPGESPEEAARRECIEESGWAPRSLRAAYRFSPIAGLSRQTFWIFRGDGADRVGDADPAESSRVEWLPRERVRAALAANEVHDGMSTVGLLHLLADLPLPDPATPANPTPTAER